MKSIALFLICIALAAPLAAQKVAVTAKRIVPAGAPAIENGVILIRDGRIEQIGGNIAIPADYSVKAYPDGIVYPGLFNGPTNLGISGVGFSSMANDTRETGDFRPDLAVFSALYPWGNLIKLTRDFGILYALVAPTGGLIPGKACLIRLHGWNPDDMVIQKEAALMVQYPNPGGGFPPMPRPKPTDAAAARQRISDYFHDAWVYHQRRLAGEAVAFDGRLEAMRPLWLQRLPVIIGAAAVDDIRAAIRLARDYNLNAILYDVYDGEGVAAEIKASGLPVLFSSLYTANQQWCEGYDKVYRQPGVLAAAGIPIAFSSSGAASGYELPLQAGRAVAYGLDRDTAMRGLTVQPLSWFGLGERFGLSPGREADFVVTDGDILDTGTSIRAVFIAGREAPLDDFFRSELERAAKRR